MTAKEWLGPAAILLCWFSGMTKLRPEELLDDADVLELDALAELEELDEELLELEDELELEELLELVVSAGSLGSTGVVGVSIRSRGKTM